MKLERRPIRTSWLGAGITALVIAAVWASAGELSATNEISRQEGMLCTSCHDKPGSKLLTDEGKYYEVMRTLDGFDQVTVAFGDCTTCHTREPGSHRLTDQGERFAWMVGDMEGLRKFLAQEHPKADGEDAPEAEDGEDGSHGETGRPDPP